MNENFCFEAETILRAFNARLDTVGTSSCLQKRESFRKTARFKQAA